MKIKIHCYSEPFQFQQKQNGFYILNRQVLVENQIQNRRKKIIRLDTIYFRILNKKNIKAY